MNLILISAMEEQLNMWHLKLKRETSRLNELSEYSKLRLETSQPKCGKTYYSVVKCGERQRHYIAPDDKVIQLIKEERYLERSIKLTRENIKWLEKFMQKVNSLDHESIDQGLHKLYRGSFTGEVIPSDKRGAIWKAEKERFKEAFHEIYPDRYPNSLRMQAADGRWMRSKAETSIADLANSKGIVNVYELPHYCNGIWILSDFTLLSPRDWMSEYIHEHEGLMSDKKYQDKHIHNQVCYMAEGYKPGINLFYSYDYLDGSFSLEPVNRNFDYILNVDPPSHFLKRAHPDDVEILRQDAEYLGKRLLL